MYLKRVVVAVLLTLGITALTGCGHIFDISGADANKAGETPYANERALLAISSAEGFVNWKLARFFALVELIEFRETNSWDGAVLSDYPLVIYNAQTELPRYYEFRVIRGNTEIGAIACAAEKSEGEPIQYVMPFAKKIAASTARFVSANKGKLIDAGYPGKLFVRSNDSSRSVDAATGKENLTRYPVDVKIKDLLENADRETLEKLGITSQETINAYLAQESAKEEKFARFWTEISEVENDILNLTKEESSQLFETSIEPMSWAGSDTSEYKLPDWTNIRTWENPGGYCGPNVIAFIMLGLGTKSGYENIPVKDDSFQLYQFYKTVENTIGTGPKYFPSLSDGLEKLTNKKYRLYSHWGFPFIFSHSWHPIDNHIRNAKLPAVSLRSSKFIDWSSPESALAWHYRAIIGTKTKTDWIKVVFIKIPYWVQHWYYMHDNGTDGPRRDAWWEPEITWYHFQAASVGKT